MTKNTSQSYNIKVLNTPKNRKEVDNMGKYCYCPTALNVTMGIFMICLAIFAFLNVWEIYMPLWLTIITAVMGVLLIFLNSVNPIHEKVEDDNLSAEKANQIHAREGY